MGKKADKKIVATGMDSQIPDINFQTSKRNMDSLTSSQQPIKMIKDPTQQHFGNRMIRSKSHFRLNQHGKEDIQINIFKSEGYSGINGRNWKNQYHNAELYHKQLQVFH